MGLSAFRGEPPGLTARAIAIVAIGLVLFAWFSHASLPWVLLAGFGLAIAGWTIARSPDVAGSQPLAGAQPRARSARTIALTLLGAALGTAAGVLHRRGLGLSLLPAGTLEPFVLVACLIGATEELVYRGWLLGKASRFGWPAAVVLAALAHAAYKTALFAGPGVPVTVDLAGVAIWTTAGGTVLGALRALSGRVLPAVAAHAAFDLVGYGAVAEAPWWVWG